MKEDSTMNATPELDPAAAGQALQQIRRTQASVIERGLIPRWFWWLIGAGMIGVGVAADTGRAPVIVAAAVAYGVLAAINGAAMVFGARGAKVSNELLGNSGVIALMLFIFCSLGLILGTGFGLKAVGFGHPGTAATILGAVTMILGGPRLMAYLRGVMLAHGAAS